MEYTKELMKHFLNPQNCGVIEDADGIGEVGSLECGDIFRFYIKVEDNIITDIKYQVFGCGAAIGISSMVSTLAKGKTLGTALQITDEQAAEEVGGLPAEKIHCSNYAASALHKAVKDYYRKIFIQSGINPLLEI